MRCFFHFRARFTVLFSSGHCEDLGQLQFWIQILRDTLHVNIVCYDYTGFGLHKGEPSEKNCYKDIFTVYNWLIQEKKIRPENIILLGKGVGSGPTLYLAVGNKGSRTKSMDISSPERIAGIILISPIASVLKLVKEHNESGWIRFSLFSNPSNPSSSNLF